MNPVLLLPFIILMHLSRPQKRGTAGGKKMILHFGATSVVKAEALLVLKFRISAAARDPPGRPRPWSQLEFIDLARCYH